MCQRHTGGHDQRPRNLDLIARPHRIQLDIGRDFLCEVIVGLGRQVIRPMQEVIALADRLRLLQFRHRIRRDHCVMLDIDRIRQLRHTGHIGHEADRVRIGCFRRLPNCRKDSVSPNLFHRVAGLEKHGISIGIFIFPGIAAPALEGAACERRRHIRNREALIVFARASRAERPYGDARCACVSAVVVRDRIAKRKIPGRNLHCFD